MVGALLSIVVGAVGLLTADGSILWNVGGLLLIKRRGEKQCAVERRNTRLWFARDSLRMLNINY